MVSKRERDEDGTITYGSSVPWLQPIVHKSSNRTSGFTHDNSIDRDPALDGFTNADVITEASKVDYLLHHHLSNKSEILRSIGLVPGMDEHQFFDKQLSLKQSQWKGAVLNKFLLPHVQELIRKWHVANAWRSFKTLDEEERQGIWLHAYDADPKRMAISMFKPVIGGMDTFNSFNRDLELDGDRANMRAVRIMLRNKYLFGCEITYTHRIAAEKKVRASSSTKVMC